MPLLDVLDHPDASASLQTPAASVAASSPAIHSHVNHLLDRVAARAGVEQQLASRSFRRGGAQHANSCAKLAVRWIFDRGAWDVSATNKAFNYVSNTLSEDHKVAKVLSGWKPNKSVPLADLKLFDAPTQGKIREVQTLLFATCQSLGTKKCNVNQRVLDVLTAYLVMHYPLLKEVNPNGPAVKRLETCVLETSHSLADLLAWSTHLVATRAPCEDEKEEAEPSDKASGAAEERKVIRHQAAVIDRFIQHAKRQDERLDVLEARLNGASAARDNERHMVNENTDKPSNKHRKQSSVAHLHASWSAWDAQEPRLWSTQGEKQKRSDAKMLVAFMKLFLGTGFTLGDQAPTYRDGAMAAGLTAENAVLSFLGEHGIRSKGVCAVLKQLRVLHRAGALNDKIARYRILLRVGSISDSAPAHTKDILEPVATP